jgi:hypothetical protein
MICTVVPAHCCSFVTFARLIVVPEHEAGRAEAEEAAECVEAGMRASPVVPGTLIHVLAGVVISCEPCARDTVAAALITTRQVAAGVLAGAVSIPQ